MFKKLFGTDDQKNDSLSHELVNNKVVHLLTESISDGVIIVNSKGIIKSVNANAAKLLGQTPKDTVDLDYKSVLTLKNTDHEELPIEQNPVEQALTRHISSNLELLLQAKNRDEIYVDINVSAINDPETNTVFGAIIILRDISRKKQEEAAKSEFISTASHEMRTPVAAIEGYLGLALNDKVSTIDTKAREYLLKAHASTQHLGRLFQDLLISTRAEDGRLESRPVVIELGEFLERLVEDFRLIAANKNLTLEFIVGANSAKAGNKVIKPLYFTYADPDRLREVITNLFDNACKYSEKGKITIGLTGDNELVQFFVRDMGIGISPDDVPHLFQKFYRLDNSTTRTTGGTGLGLYISKKILELYKGRIWVESKQGEGSTFYVNLPRLSSAEAEIKRAKTPPPSL